MPILNIRIQYGIQVYFVECDKYLVISQEPDTGIQKTELCDDWNEATAAMEDAFTAYEIAKAEARKASRQAPVWPITFGPDKGNGN